MHFTRDDLFRLRFAGEPDPLWEIVLSFHLLAASSRPVMFDPWRASVRPQVRRLPPWQLRLLRALAPPVGDFPDFLTPHQGNLGVEEGVESVLSTPRRRLRRELGVLPAMPAAVRPLADGCPKALAGLGETLRGYYRAAVAPFWSRCRALVESERAARARALLDQGVEGLLSGMGPAIRWLPPVLEVDYHLEHDIHLTGRGVVLVPSAFCWRRPITLVDPDLPPVLVYPLPRSRSWWAGLPGAPAGAGPQALANLLGPTRAACLRVIEDGCTTGELARRIGVAPPTASVHATTLRESGLTASTRHGNTVLHTLTPLGLDLLRVNAGA